MPLALGVAVLSMGVALTISAAAWESARRTIYLQYDLQGEGMEGYGQVVEGFNQLASCQKVWVLDASTRLVALRDQKSHAGASELVRRRAAVVGSGFPPWVEANIRVPTILARGQTLYLLPDGILVYDPSGVGHVGYGVLRLTAGTTRFIEESPPPDAAIVDRTWLYPNKSGGPDKRYSTNYQIPVCLYGELILESPSGLQLYVHTSRPDAPEGFRSGCVKLLSLARGGRRSQLEPTVEVNPEHFESFPLYIGTRLAALGPILLSALESYDAWLRRVAGEGNTIVFHFLRILSVGAASAIALSVLWGVVRLFGK